jgi:DNA-binding MarR family transcriptional regulator
MSKPRRTRRASTRPQAHRDHRTASQRRDRLVCDAEEILATIRLLWRDLLRNPYADAEAFGITGPQITVMACLVTRGPITLTELSRSLGMSHSTASGIVDRLETRGLVRRSEDATDRRRTAIAVTQGVTRYVRDLEAGPSGRLVRALERASPTQRAAVTAGLRSLCDLLGIKRHPA